MNNAVLEFRPKEKPFPRRVWGRTASASLTVVDENFASLQSNEPKNEMVVIGGATSSISTTYTNDLENFVTVFDQDSVDIFLTEEIQDKLIDASERLEELFPNRKRCLYVNLDPEDYDYSGLVLSVEGNFSLRSQEIEKFEEFCNNWWYEVYKELGGKLLIKVEF